MLKGNGGTAAYVRVSSRAQNHATQRAAIVRAAALRRERIALWYVETASGRTVDRPVLKRLLRAARRGEVRRLYLYRLDRLTRSGIADTLTVLAELRGAGCEVRTVADAIDLEGPSAELVIAVLSWAAQIERQKIRENIAKARERIEGEGGRWGRPRRASAAKVRAVRSKRKKGHTIRQIAASERIPRSTVCAIVGGRGAYAA